MSSASTRTFEFKDDKSSKFWEIALVDTTVTVRFGKTGTKGQNNNKVYLDEASAFNYVEKLIKEKIGKGYVEVLEVNCLAESITNFSEKGVTDEFKENLNNVNPLIKMRNKLSEEIGVLLEQISSEQHDHLIKIKSLIDLADDCYTLKFSEMSTDEDSWQNDEFACRTQSMIGGPFFTSEKFPQNPALMPVVQLDLNFLSQSMDKNLGSGLFQLWYIQGRDFNDADGPIIVYIPQKDVAKDVMSKWDFHFYDEAEVTPIEPLTTDWVPFYWRQEWRAIEGFIYAGVQCQDNIIRQILKTLNKAVPDDFLSRIYQFLEQCTSVKENNILIFGSFEAISYSHADIGKPCLMTFPFWGEDGSGGNSQIFFEKDESQKISFEFKQNWFDSIESRDRFVNFASMNKKSYVKTKLFEHNDFIQHCQKKVLNQIIVCWYWHKNVIYMRRS